MKKSITIIWKGKQQGTIQINGGKIEKMVAENGKIEKNHFSFGKDTENKLTIVFDYEVENGSHGPIVNVLTKKDPFSFFLQHISKQFPVFIPEYNVIVTEADDNRSFDLITEDIKKNCGMSKLKEIEFSDETCYEMVENKLRKLRGHLWLGISRDMRIFEIVFPDPDRTTMQILPKYHGFGIWIDELEKTDDRNKKMYGSNLIYNLNFGRGCGCSQELKRYLVKGYLPVLCGVVEDEGINYNFTMFATLENKPLRAENIRGTHFLVADGFGAGHMFTQKQQEMFDNLVDQELYREEETVLFLKIEAVNKKYSPGYAYFHVPYPNTVANYKLENGLMKFSQDRIFAVVTINGLPLERQEFTVFLKPGEKVEVIMKIPHKPVSMKRALALMKQSFDERKNECIEFWEKKIESTAKIQLPEKRIENIIKAGVIHLDIVAYGLEPDGPVAACIGRYCPIGSESSPIIQFFDTIGWHKLAERSIQYFVEKQHEDGFMQNFGGYMLETGAVLWNMGEHFRCTGDTTWIRKIKPSIIKAANYIIQWIERNKVEQLCGRGYGMINGKVGDPEDPYHIFMLNGYAYLGLQRASELLEAIDEPESEKIKKYAEQLKKDIRNSFFSAMARSPVVPLGDGTWVPTVPPWPEYDGLLIQYSGGEKWFTHGTFIARDSIIGPMYLIFQQVIEPDELASDFMVKYHVEHFYKNNVAFSQPYYSRHPVIHLKRGEVKSFLKAYYSCFPAIIDRETKTFWEHFFYASPHKTHEEAWFLMETRWMLCMEDENVLSIFPGIPRKWLEDGNTIKIQNLSTHFGNLSVDVVSDISNNSIVAKILCKWKKKPETIQLRIPHPDKLVAKKVSTGKYDIKKESVILKNFQNAIEVMLKF